MHAHARVRTHTHTNTQMHTTTRIHACINTHIYTHTKFNSKRWIMWKQVSSMICGSGYDSQYSCDRYCQQAEHEQQKKSLCAEGANSAVS